MKKYLLTFAALCVLPLCVGCGASTGTGQVEEMDEAARAQQTSDYERYREESMGSTSSSELADE
jgi:hypothetical protein